MTVGLCLFITDFVSDLEKDLNQFNSDFVERTDAGFLHAERIKMKIKLIDISRFHSEAEE